MGLNYLNYYYYYYCYYYHPPINSSIVKLMESLRRIQSGSLIHHLPCIGIRLMVLRTILRPQGRFHLSLGKGKVGSQAGPASEETLVGGGRGGGRRRRGC